MSILEPQQLTTLSSLIMAVIWFIYLQLFLLEYRHRNRPFLIIHHAQGKNPDSLCLFVNMSQDPVHVQCVIADVECGERKLRHYVTDYQRITADDDNVTARLRQGPIAPGGYLVLGTFRDIILGHQSNNSNNTDNSISLENIESLQICIAVNHGPSKFPIGARRHFFLENDAGKTIVRSQSIHTEQLVTRRKRQTVREWVESGLEPRESGRQQTQQTSQAG